MPNNVLNKLEIICEDDKTMSKIRMMIFEEDEKRNKIFTMEKLLPRPAKFSDTKGYNEYGYDWSLAVWGTKWDVYDFNILDSGNTITINYYTAWNPNVSWLEMLCHYIQATLNFDNTKEPPFISVKLHYTDFMGFFGGLWEWVPYKNPLVQRYTLLQYARLHDSKLYESVTEYLEWRRSDGSKNNESMNEDTDILPF
jgi:hypothetical protein